MLLLYLITGDCIEVPSADVAMADGGYLRCVSSAGREIVAYPIEDIEAFTSNVRLAALIKAEVCRNLTVFDAEGRPVKA